METSTVKLEFPEGANIILGMTHFIKSVEDLYEIMVNSAPSAKFGIAFCEASQERLIRFDGNDEKLQKVAVNNALNIGAGHSFIIVMTEAFPITVLNDIKNCREVCRIFCATANPCQVVVAETDLGRGILGVVDGNSPAGVEDEQAMEERKKFLRTIGYKR